MAEESFQEKTEQATPKRRQESRKKGQVARSQELNSAVLLLVALGGLYARAAIPEAEPGQSYLVLSVQILPTGVRGFFLAGILATILSTLARLGLDGGILDKRCQVV